MINLILFKMFLILMILINFKLSSKEIIFDNKLSGKLKIYGEFEDDIIYHLKVIEIRNQKIIINFENNEINKNKIEYGDNFIIIKYMDYILDGRCNLQLVPIDSTHIKIENDSVFYETKIIFTPPILKNYNSKMFDVIIEKIKNKSIKLDEIDIFKIFMGAIFEYKNLKHLFFNINEYVELDGAISETYFELLGLYKYINKINLNSESDE